MIIAINKLISTQTNLQSLHMGTVFKNGFICVVEDRVRPGNGSYGYS